MEDFDRFLSEVNLDELCCHTKTNESLSTTSAPLRFAGPKSNKELQEARQNAMSKNTVKSTNWAVNFEEWTTHRREVCGPMDCPPHLVICTDYQLDYWISKFISEVRKVDGQTYPPNSLYSICCGLMRFIRELEVRPTCKINFFKDLQFVGLQTTLDSEMKRLCSQGVGVKQKRAEEEEILWEKGLLGEDSPKVLLDMIYMYLHVCGVHFALRSGQE